MTDERLAELEAERDKVTDQHAAITSNMAAMKDRVAALSSECTKTNEARKALLGPHKALGDRLGNLCKQIKDEQNRRAEEAVKAKQAEREAVKQAE